MESQTVAKAKKPSRPAHFYVVQFAQPGVREELAELKALYEEEKGLPPDTLSAAMVGALAIRAELARMRKAAEG